MANLTTKGIVACSNKPEKENMAKGIIFSLKNEAT